MKEIDFSAARNTPYSRAKTAPSAPKCAARAKRARFLGRFWTDFRDLFRFLFSSPPTHLGLLLRELFLFNKPR